MSTGNGDKPPTSPGRPAADTPQRVVVGMETGHEALGASDTAVAMASKPGERTSLTDLGRSATDAVKPLDKSMLEGDLIGTTLSGRYQITRKLGQGGMGAVYEATHTLINKKVAVKVLLEKYAKRQAIVQRLEQEAKLASSLDNDHIIDITDFGTTEDGRTFVVMEFLEGESLAECLARETKLPEQRILRIASQCALALVDAHAKGIVHRDIKPENLFLEKRKDLDFVKVVDFGISKSLRATGEDEEQPRLTQTGMVLGTPLYMSPEQARGDEELDARVDLYAIGVIMYECATGRVPFSGTNYLSVISQVLNEDPTPVRELRPDLSEEFEAIVLKLMAKERTARYANATDVLSDITSLLDDPTHSTERAKITGPRRKAAVAPKGASKILAWVAGVAVLVAVIVVTVMLTMGRSNKPGPTVAPPTPPVVTHAIPADAAVPTTTPDAGPLPSETVEYTIETVPSGAQIFKEGIEYGRSPQKVELVRKDKDTEFLARAPAYNDHPFKLNPAEDKDHAIRILLEKPKQGAPLIRTDLKKQTGGAGSGSDQGATIDGSTGDPYKHKPGP